MFIIERRTAGVLAALATTAAMVVLGNFREPVDEIETPLSAHLAPRAAPAMIDLSQVTFVGSGGIRMFITIARARSTK